MRPVKKVKNCTLVCSCEFMMRHALHVLSKHSSHFLSIMIWSSSIPYSGKFSQLFRMKSVCENKKCEIYANASTRT